MVVLRMYPKGMWAAGGRSRASQMDSSPEQDKTPLDPKVKRTKAQGNPQFPIPHIYMWRECYLNDTGPLALTSLIAHHGNADDCHWLMFHDCIKLIS